MPLGKVIICYCNIYSLKSNYILMFHLQLNESADISLKNCSNISAVQLEEIHSRLVLYNSLSRAFATVNELMDKVDSRPIHYCAWINNRVFDDCNDRNSSSPDQHLKHTLNTVLCNRDDVRNCRPELCLYNNSQMLLN